MIDLLGGPSKVAEMTARRARIIRKQSSEYSMSRADGRDIKTIYDMRYKADKFSDTVNIKEVIVYMSSIFRNDCNLNLLKYMKLITIDINYLIQIIY